MTEPVNSLPLARSQDGLQAGYLRRSQRTCSSAAASILSAPRCWNQAALLECHLLITLQCCLGCLPCGSWAGWTEHEWKVIPTRVSIEWVIFEYSDFTYSFSFISEYQTNMNMVNLLNTIDTLLWLYSSYLAIQQYQNEKPVEV